MFQKIIDWIKEKILDIGLSAFDTAHKLFDWIPGAKAFINHFEKITEAIIATGIVLLILFFTYPYILQALINTIMWIFKTIFKMFINKIEEKMNNSFINKLNFLFKQYIKVFLYIIGPHKIVTDAIGTYIKNRKKKKKRLKIEKQKIQNYIRNIQQTENVLIQQEQRDIQEIQNLKKMVSEETQNTEKNNPII